MINEEEFPKEKKRKHYKMVRNEIVTEEGRKYYYYKREDLKPAVTILTQSQGQTLQTRNSQNHELTIGIARKEELLDDLDREMQEEQGKAVNTYKYPIIKIQVGEWEVPDTGAQVSLITQATYNQVVKERAVLDEIPIKTVAVKGAFSERGHAVKTKIKLNFKFNNRRFDHVFFVMEKMAYDMILGIDFLTRYKMNLKCGEKTRIEFEVQPMSPVTLNAINMKNAKEELNKIIQQNKELFRNEIGKVSHYTHKIQTHDKQPYKSRIYPIPNKIRDQVRNEIIKYEQEGIMEKKATQYINPLVAVKKPNGKI